MQRRDLELQLANQEDAQIKEMKRLTKLSNRENVVAVIRVAVIVCVQAAVTNENGVNAYTTGGYAHFTLRMT